MGAVQYFGNAAKVYVGTEIAIGMGLGLVAGAVWKNWHWQTRSKEAAYFASIKTK